MAICRRVRFGVQFLCFLSHSDKGDKGDNDSDSDSDASMDRNSLELASSHSSDEDDDFDLNPAWENQIPKTKAVGEETCV